MKKSELAKLKRLVKKLEECRVIADDMNLLNGSGGEIGSLIGSIADELSLELLPEVPDAA